MNLFAITALFLLFNPAISISDTNHVHNVTVNFTSFVNGDSYLAMSDPVVGPGYSGSMGGWGTVSISFDPPSTIIECDGTIGYNVTLVMYGDLYDAKIRLSVSYFYHFFDDTFFVFTPLSN